MSTDLYTRNNAPNVNGYIVNGNTVAEHQTVRGSDFYFAICAVMGTVALGTIGASMLKPRTDRIFFYITAAINFTAFIAYFCMGSNLGWTPIDVEFPRSNPKVAGVNRQIFYVRYIDWVITTPLLLMDLLLTAAMPWPTILWVIFLDEIMIITGLIGALVSTRYKFAFWTFGTVAMFYIFYELAITGRKHAAALGKDVHRVFTACGVLTLFIWLLYPVAWGCCEGGNVIPTDSEAVFYGVLDFCAKPIFSIMLIAGHWNISPGRLGLSIKEFGHTTPEESRGEKDPNSSSSGNSTSNNHSAGINTTPVGNDSGRGPHAAHTTGYAPTYEGVTTESGAHTATQRV